VKNAIRIINKIIGIITNIIIIMLAIVITYFIFQVKVKNHDKDEVIGYTLFLVNTGSMKDAININDIVIVKKTKDVNVDDIIAFETDGNLIVHRIIEQNIEEIITKGDANNQEDAPIRSEQVIGKVVQKVPLRNIILGIVIVIILNIILELSGKTIEENMERRKKNEEKKKDT